MSFSVNKPVVAAEEPIFENPFSTSGLVDSDLPMEPITGRATVNERQSTTEEDPFDSGPMENNIDELGCEDIVNDIMEKLINNVIAESVTEPEAKQKDEMQVDNAKEELPTIEFETKNLPNRIDLDEQLICFLFGIVFGAIIVAWTLFSCSSSD